MKFRIVMIVSNPQREIITNLYAADAEEARTKARALYTVERFKSVETTK